MSENEVTERLVIPVETNEGLKSRLSQHFGRAPYFMVVELDDQGGVLKLQMENNTSEHLGGKGLPPDIIISLNPTALITYGMGRRAIDIFQTANVAVLQTNKLSVADAIQAYVNKELMELTEGCQHTGH